VVVGGLALFGQRIGTLEMVGTLVGFGGVALLSAGDIQVSGDIGATLVGSLLALGSATVWAIYTAFARRLGRADPLVTTAITSFIGSALVAAIAVPTQDWTRLGHASTPVLLATLWAGAGVQALSFVWVLFSPVARLREIPEPTDTRFIDAFPAS